MQPYVDANFTLCVRWIQRETKDAAVEAERKLLNSYDYAFNVDDNHHLRRAVWMRDGHFVDALLHMDFKQWDKDEKKLPQADMDTLTEIETLCNALSPEARKCLMRRLTTQRGDRRRNRQ